MAESESQASIQLDAHLRGDPRAAAKLMPLVYDELHALAAKRMRGERADHTLQATALVHEAYLRLVGRGTAEQRTHFLAIGATTLRRILVDHANGKNAIVHGGNARRVVLEESIQLDAPQADTLALDVALEKLAAVSARQARIVELRFFGGLTVQEVATTLDIGPDTVKREWRLARAWLNRELMGARRDA